ncbi:P-loop containing nucleoside triphosphate hydrolase protein [Astrocystis sublimbata]|nr:P-loop containing nucleoside triphosphate hydrolase protein [Astrocystis sublimbata]
MMVVFCVGHLLAAEYILAQPSRGEVLVFKRNSAREKDGLGKLEAAEPPVKDQSTSSRLIEQVPQTSQDPAFIHWESLSFSIKTKQDKRAILNNIDGWLEPGTITALMGVTGAGKTTLLDVLSQRVKAGVISGEVYVNGRSRNASFQRRIGYVQQKDFHLSTATVRKALNFSAALQRPRNIAREEKQAYVEEVIEQLDIEQYADAVIGLAGDGLNVEQRKTLSIALELVAKPDLLLFLDEPTSGLDSQTAWSICSLLRKLAANGQTVLYTIYQPSF